MNRGYNSTASILRWAARAASVLALVVILPFFFGENGRGPNAKELVGLLFFPFGVLVGMAIAWRREALGAAVSVLSLAAFYVIYGALVAGRIPAGPWFAVFTLPAPLFFASWVAHRGGEGNRVARA